MPRPRESQPIQIASVWVEVFVVAALPTRILFDQGTPAPLRRHLSGHTAYEMGWSDLANGNLLTKAESQFDLIMTACAAGCAGASVSAPQAGNSANAGQSIVGFLQDVSFRTSRGNTF